MSSVLEKYLSGDSFTGKRKKKIDVDKWIALHTKPVKKEPVAAVEEVPVGDSSITRELRELQELVVPRTAIAPSQKVILLPDKNVSIDTPFKKREVDVWHPDIISVPSVVVESVPEREQMPEKAHVTLLKRTA